LEVCYIAKQDVKKVLHLLQYKSVFLVLDLLYSHEDAIVGKNDADTDSWFDLQYHHRDHTLEKTSEDSPL
jgi:hypothetical protein